MAKTYTTKTAALKATTADIRKVDTKKLNINGTPFSKVVSDNVPETPTENDIWKYAVTTDDNGVVTVTDDVTVDYSELTGAQKNITKTAAKVIDNKVLDANDTLLMNWDTKNFTNENGSNMISIFNGSQNITEWDSDLSSLTNGYFMFFGTALESFSGDLSSLADGTMMFISTPLQSFSSDLSSLTNGVRMFSGIALTSWDIDLPRLIEGNYMFEQSSLQSFNCNLSSLKNGRDMFNYCTALQSFNSDLSNLTNGSSMFDNTALTSWNRDLSSLADGYSMFSYTALQSFSGDLSSLTNGYWMFISTPLQSFSGDLSSLTSGTNMFSGCKLDPQSIMIINDSIRDITAEKSSLTDADYVTRTGTGTTADPYIYSKPFGWMSDGTYVYTYHSPKPLTTTINSSNVGTLAIGINVTNDSSTIDTQLQEFAEAAYYDSWADLKQAFANKGWTVTWQYGGTSTSITLSEDEAFRGVPVWAKIEEVIHLGETYTEEEIAKAEYCTEDGSKYYNISWGHDVNDEAKDETMTDETKFFYFGSLLEACGYWGIIPKQYLEA